MCTYEYDASDCNAEMLRTVVKESVQNMIRIGDGFIKQFVIYSLAQFFKSVGLAYNDCNVELCYCDDDC